MRNLYLRITQNADTLSMIKILRHINPSFNLQTEKLIAEAILHKYQALEISQDDFINLMCDCMTNKTLADCVNRTLLTDRQAVNDYYPSAYNEKSVNVSNLGLRIS